MQRRDLLKLGVSTAAAPAVGAAQQAASVPASSIKGAGAAWQPALFDAHQNETVVALTELIIPATDTPGAKAAQVNRYFDLLLNDGPADRREAFLSGLSWLDGYAMKLHSRPFVRCSAAEQTAILKTLDEGKDPNVQPGTRFFRMAKGFTARIYYSTEIGFKELNKGGRVPDTFGCKHTDHA